MEAVRGAAVTRAPVCISRNVYLTLALGRYVATYGQSYTERYFASYYHSQVCCCCCCCCCCLRSCVQQLPFPLPHTHPPPSHQMLPVYGAAAALDYLKQNNLPTDHLH